MNEKCGRTVMSSFGEEVCELRPDHKGAHKSYWRSREGRRVWLSWTHEKDGHAVFPTAPGATKVVA